MSFQHDKPMLDGIRLSRAYPEDCDDMVAAMQNPEVSRWLTSVPQPYGLNDAAQFVAETGPMEYAIRVGDRLAGMVRADKSFGIWVAPGFQRQGIGLRAAVLALSRRFLADENPVESVCLEGNERSFALHAVLGFEKVGAVTAWSRGTAAELPATLLRLTRADFASRHSFALTTSRLRLDSFTPADLSDLHRIATMPPVARMLLRFSSDMTLAEIAPIFTGEALTPSMRLVARYQGRVVGTIGMLAGQPPSLAYFIDPALAGQGVGQEMAGAFLTEFITRYDPPQLQAEVFDDNPASSRILRNLGFQRIEDITPVSMGRDAASPAGVYRWQRRQ